MEFKYSHMTEVITGGFPTLSMIAKFQPFSPTKELGQEYNSHVALIPPKTWDGKENYCLILDYDCMILDPRSYLIMEKAIDLNPDTDIFSAYASRIGYPFQRLRENHLDDNDSIRHHLEISKRMADEFPNGETKEIPTAAGFFLLFKKSYWERNKFQDKIQEGVRLFDHNFCKEASNKGTIRIIKGIYCWHSYRIDKNHRDGSHLR